MALTKHTQTLSVQTDIYLIDQILKGRYNSGEKILDAGCGGGRNLDWFLANDVEIWGIDVDEHAILQIRKNCFEPIAARFLVSAVESMPFADCEFDHIICSAVLHFATNEAHFKQMIAQLIRVLKPGGSLFIRMTSDIGIENLVTPIGGGVYLIPDGSKRFLLNKTILAEIMQKHGLSFLEPLKTVNVDDIRSMSTLVFQKN